MNNNIDVGNLIKVLERLIKATLQPEALEPEMIDHSSELNTNLTDIITILKAYESASKELPEKIKIDHYENPFHYHKSIGFNELHDIATPIIQARDREIRELKAEIEELKNTPDIRTLEVINNELRKGV